MARVGKSTVREQCPARVSILPRGKNRTDVQCGQDFFPIGDLLFDHSARIVGFIAKPGWTADGCRLRVTGAALWRLDHRGSPPEDPRVTLFQRAATQRGVMASGSGVTRPTWKWAVGQLPPILLAECPKHRAMDVVIDLSAIVREQSDKVSQIEEDLSEGRKTAHHQET